MYQTFVTLVYAVVPIVFVGFLLKYCLKIEETVLWLKAWVIFLSVAVVLQNIWLVYLSIWFVAAKLVPRDFETRVFFYIALLFALPKLPFYLPFPGIGGLWVMTYPQFLALAFFLTFYKDLSGRESGLSFIDKVVLVFVIYTTVLDFRGHDAITQSVRLVVSNFLGEWLPYWFVSKTRADLKRLLLALYMVGVALAFEAVVEWGVVWKTYTTIAGSINGVMLDELRFAYHFRGLGLRISSSWMGPIPFGVFMSVTCVIALNVDKIGLKRGLISYCMAAVCFAAALFTDSRGALLALVIGMFVLFYYYRASSVWKVLFKFCTVVMVALVLTNLDVLFEVDSSGTFEYRAQLITYSHDAISRAPLFGTPDFMENEVLVANMTQGQGIVDIVNHYLSVTLRYGFVGLALYLLVWGAVVLGVAKRVSKIQRIGNSDYFAGALLVSVMVGVAVVIFTVSLVGYLSEYIMLLFAIGSAYLKNTKNLLSSRGS